MPSPNTLKEYQPKTYYHLYNSGVANQPIFLDKQDYLAFLHQLKETLGSPPKPRHRLANYAAEPRARRRLFGELDLYRYCLQSHHYHLLVYQKSGDAIRKLAQSVFTAYAQFANRRHHRVGPFFRGVYRAKKVRNLPINI